MRRAQTLVVIDHHRQSADAIENAHLSYIEPYSSSACEMVTEIMQYMVDSVKMKPYEADALYSGIMMDTNNFSNRTGVRTFEAAAYLRKNGADIVRVRKMFRDDIGDYKAKAKAIQNTEIFMDKSLSEQYQPQSDNHQYQFISDRNDHQHQRRNRYWYLFFFHIINLCRLSSRCRRCDTAEEESNR